MSSEFPSRFLSAEESPGFQLWRASNLWQQSLRHALTPFDLTHVQLVLLSVTAYLTQQGAETNQIQIAQAAQTDKMVTSQAIRTLQERGLVDRSVQPNDARARRVSITEAGSRLLAEALPAVENADAAFFGVLGEEVGILSRLAVRLAGAKAEIERHDPDTV